jgi:hypothetical protein
MFRYQFSSGERGLPGQPVEFSSVRSTVFSQSLDIPLRLLAGRGAGIQADDFLIRGNRLGAVNILQTGSLVQQM